MAIEFENKYHKITKSINNFSNNTTEIEMDVYASSETREREKLLKDKAHDLIAKINEELSGNAQNLIKEINKITPIDSIKNQEKFLKEHPNIKKQIDSQEAIQKEGLEIVDGILKKDIDFDNLKFKEKWINMGLTKDLCKKIEYFGTTLIGIEGIREPNLSNLYDAVKEKIVSPVIDN